MNSLYRFFLCAVALFAFLTFGCSPNLRKLPQKSEPQQTAVAAKPDSTNSDKMDMVSDPVSNPGLLSGIGSLFSTPEGVARRQAVKLAKASAPKVGKKAQATIIHGNGNTSTQDNTNKAHAPTTAAAPDATVSNAAENSQQQAVKGDGNQLSAKQANPTQAAPDWKAALTGPTGKVIGAALAVALIGGGIYGFIWWRKKKQTQSIIS